MKVYRIEEPKTGFGPFALGVAKPIHYEGPGPIEDGVFGTYQEYFEKMVSGEGDKYRYGFQSKKHLQRWFKERDLKYFKSNKLSIVEYDIPEWKVYHGGRQCAFRPKDAYKKRTVPIKRVLH